MTGDLVEFLAARLAEDEATARSVEPLGHTDALGGLRIDHAFSVARLVASGEDGSYTREGDTAAASHFRRHDPARVLREVEAKRQVLRLYTNAASAVEHASGFQPQRTAIQDETCVEILGAALRALATAWSDHPDFREKWVS